MTFTRRTTSLAIWTVRLTVAEAVSCVAGKAACAVALFLGAPAILASFVGVAACAEVFFATLKVTSSS